MSLRNSRYKLFFLWHAFTSPVVSHGFFGSSRLLFMLTSIIGQHFSNIYVKSEIKVSYAFFTSSSFKTVSHVSVCSSQLSELMFSSFV